MNTPSNSMTEADMWRCHQFLAGTDTAFGEAVANKNRCERLLKSKLALLKQQCNEKSNVAKEDSALASETYQLAVQEEFEAVKTLEVLKAQRSSAQTKIDIWRSLEASRRRS